MPVIFQKRDRDFVGYTPRSPKVRYKAVSRKGEVYDVGGGREVELFKIRVFGEAIDRSPDVIKQWIKKGYMPPSLYEVTKHPCKHWYSREQILNCARLFMGRWKGKKHLTRPGEFTRFVADLKEVYYARGEVVNEDGTIDREALKKEQRA